MLRTANIVWSLALVLAFGSGWFLGQRNTDSSSSIRTVDTTSERGNGRSYNGQPDLENELQPWKPAESTSDAKTGTSQANDVRQDTLARFINAISSGQDRAALHYFDQLDLGNTNLDLIASVLVERLFQISLQNLSRHSSFQTLLAEFAANVPHEPLSQLVALLGKAASQPDVALAEFDELSSYYQEQISASQLAVVETWLLSSTERQLLAGNSVAAIESWYALLISRSPDPSSLYARLAQIRFEQKRYEDSLTALNSAPPGADIDALYDANISALEKLSVDKIPLRRLGEHFIVAVNINGRSEANLLIDTGASLTSLDSGFASRARLPRSSQTLRLNTAGGIVEAPLSPLQSMSIANYRLINPEVAVLDLGGNYDGLLGMDFLGQYDFFIDQRQALLFLRAADDGQNQLPFSQ